MDYHLPSNLKGNTYRYNVFSLKRYFFCVFRKLVYHFEVVFFLVLHNRKTWGRVCYHGVNLGGGV